MGERTERGLGAGWIIAIYCALKPVYLFSSGTMQLCDYFLVLALLLLAAYQHLRLPIPSGCGSFLKLFAIILVYQTAVNTAWYLAVRDTRMLFSNLYYVFNFLSLYTTLWIYLVAGLERTIRSLTLGCFLGVLIAGSGAFASSGVGSRNMALFNNPNQLGYFGVIALTVLACFPKAFSRRQRVIVVVLSVWLVIVSASKAAFLGMAGLAAAYSIFAGERKSVSALLRRIVLLLILFTIFYLFFYSENSIITGNRSVMFLRRRIFRMSTESDSGLEEGRGYGRILETGVHFLWGMGEGGYSRFAALTGKEAHSTYVNLIVSYGWLGFAAYSFFFSRIIRGKDGVTRRNLACLSGLLLYFITHNGVRNTLFWILLGTLLAVQLEKKKTEHTLETVEMASGKVRQRS